MRPWLPPLKFCDLRARMSERSGRSKRAGRRRRLHRAPSDDGFDRGYITYLLVDYEVKVRYRFAMLRILREQSCNDGEDAQGAHEPQGQVASIPCSRPVSPCSCRQAGRPDRRRDARVSCFLPGAYGEVTGARLCRASCFFPVIYRTRSAGRAIPTCANGIARHCTLAHPISRRSKKCRIDRRFLVVRDCSGSHLTVAKGRYIVVLALSRRHTHLTRTASGANGMKAKKPLTDRAIRAL